MRYLKMALTATMGVAAMLSTAGHGIEPPVMVALALASGYAGWNLFTWAERS